MGTSPPKTEAKPARAIPTWHVSRRPEFVGDALSVLARARDLIADKKRWCQRSFARTWLDIPVPVQSRFARRYLRLGALACRRELGLPFDKTREAFKWRTLHSVAGGMTIPFLIGLLPSSPCSGFRQGCRKNPSFNFCVESLLDFVNLKPCAGAAIGRGNENNSAPDFWTR
jgi:hypothetical protein